MARIKSSLHIDEHGSSQTVDRSRVKSARTTFGVRVIMGLLVPLVSLILLAPIASAGEQYEYKDLSLFMEALKDNELLRQDVVRKPTDKSAPIVIIKRAKVHSVRLVNPSKGYVTVMTYTQEDGAINLGIVKVPQIKEFLPSMPFIQGLKRDDEVAIVGTVYEYSHKTDSAGHLTHGVYFLGTVAPPPEE